MKIKILITLICVAGIAVHLIWPTFTIDLITIILLLVAILPWTASIIKSLELPGGFKIELQDIKAATDKVTSAPVESKAQISGSTSESAALEIADKENDTIATLRNVAENDPNLALVGVRIEIEKRLLELARRRQIDTSRKSLGYLLRQLQQDQTIPPEVASGLNELTALGNRAAHGAGVSPDAAAWVLDTAPTILGILDDIILRKFPDYVEGAPNNSFNRSAG
jgi:hypothetical protein